MAARTTHAIQALLGLWIALTLALVVYVLVDAAGNHAPRSGETGEVSPRPGSGQH